MEVTDVRVVMGSSADGRLMAYATITLDDCFLVRELRIIRGKLGPFVAMPSRRRKDGKFVDIAHPLTKELREHIEAAVMKAYAELIADRVTNPYLQETPRSQTSLI